MASHSMTAQLMASTFAELNTELDAFIDAHNASFDATDGTLNSYKADVNLLVTTNDGAGSPAIPWNQRFGFSAFDDDAATIKLMLDDWTGVLNTLIGTTSSYTSIVAITGSLRAMIDYT